MIIASSEILASSCLPYSTSKATPSLTYSSDFALVIVHACRQQAEKVACRNASAALILKMEAMCSSGTSGSLQTKRLQPRRLHI
jgi:hypothetical protein